VDVWSVGVGVPSDNAYWTGASAAAAELVLFDPAARFTGDAAGRDTAQRAVRVVFDVRYDTRLRPRGTVAVQTPVGSFTGKDPRWVVQVGSRAIIDQAGTLAGRPASLRLRVDDNAEPARPDTFRVVTTGYDSGTVTVLSGNLQSHPAM